MNGRAYYNEIDPFAAAWLRELIAAGHIAPGDVDERSVVDVKPDDVAGYTQCHFFAGIGGWSYALRLAGVPDGSRIWTGSCPCQPLSSAGQRKGHLDERHLWPAFHDLIAERRPSIVFGEQVASKDGREWLAAVRVDLETLGYRIGAADLCAAGVGAPHIRQRLYWVADTNRNGLEADAHEAVIRHAADDVGRTGRLGEVGASGQWTEPRPSGARPMALGNGLPADVGRLRAYGNAIVPKQAAEFISAYLECERELAA